jgi:hypothetical protein
MQNSKRLIVATLSGLVLGFVCFGLASSGPTPLPWPVAAQIIASRTLIGFAIGVSALSFGHWSVHGIVMGFLFSIPLAFSSLTAPVNPEFSHPPVFILVSLLVSGLIYGFVIELVTTVFFKARQQA